MDLLDPSFYFIRHGDADFLDTFDLYAELDVLLTDLRKQQADSLCEFIEKLPFQSICVSPLKRTLQTQQILTQNLSNLL